MEHKVIEGILVENDQHSVCIDYLGSTVQIPFTKIEEYAAHHTGLSDIEIDGIVSIFCKERVKGNEALESRWQGGIMRSVEEVIGKINDKLNSMPLGYLGDSVEDYYKRRLGEYSDMLEEFGVEGTAELVHTDTGVEIHSVVKLPPHKLIARSRDCDSIVYVDKVTLDKVKDSIGGIQCSMSAVEV
jgi:hypothetical protein